MTLGKYLVQRDKKRNVYIYQDLSKGLDGTYKEFEGSFTLVELPIHEMEKYDEILTEKARIEKIIFGELPSQIRDNRR